MATGGRKKRVAIVGGGPAGATVALTLARRGVKTVVIETQSGPEPKIGECLPPNANPLLEQLGLKNRLGGEDHLTSHGNRSLWGSSNPVERDFLFGTKGAGWQLDRLKFEQTLATAAREQGAQWHYGYRLSECLWQDGKWALRVKTPTGDKHLEADFVVDASGRVARLARQFGARHIRYDRLIGVAALMKSEGGMGIKDSLTLVEAVASGWWYSARLPRDQLIVIYMTDSDLVDHNAVRQTRDWFALLDATEQTKRRALAGDYRPVSEPRILPANSARLDKMTGERWLAVGDAAAAYDPLASYGISAAMGAGFYAASAIADSLEGDHQSLQSYERILDLSYARYLLMHQEYYGLERRWPDETFWRRRHHYHQHSANYHGESLI
ncbi:MAG TPA: NAD(P)/FAD-dependent oxidoreductase [Pyrinomonadaceae bacterium]|jgi:flavin-dependent dehydrogenase